MSSKADTLELQTITVELDRIARTAAVRVLVHPRPGVPSLQVACDGDVAAVSREMRDCLETTEHPEIAVIAGEWNQCVAWIRKRLAA